MYFGINASLLQLTRELITKGNKPAALALNQAIRVLGSDIEPSTVIEKITKDFRLDKIENSLQRQRQLQRLAKEIHDSPDSITIDKKIDLLKQLGGEFQWGKGLFTTSCEVAFAGVARKFPNGKEFGKWLLKEIIPQLLVKS